LPSGRCVGRAGGKASRVLAREEEGRRWQALSKRLRAGGGRDGVGFVQLGGRRPAGREMNASVAVMQPVCRHCGGAFPRAFRLMDAL
jgi:hypothetical protein